MFHHLRHLGAFLRKLVFSHGQLVIFVQLHLSHASRLVLHKIAEDFVGNSSNAKKKCMVSIKEGVCDSRLLYQNLHDLATRSHAAGAATHCGGERDFHGRRDCPSYSGSNMQRDDDCRGQSAGEASLEHLSHCPAL
eukprot:3330100-Pleurochrysis_carterae.AAC.1